MREKGLVGMSLWMQTRVALLDDLARVIADHSTALLLVTHDPDEAGGLPDRTIRLGPAADCR